MNEEMLRGLTSRRSNRAFAPEQITDEELHKVLAAGMNAPTAIIRDLDLRKPIYRRLAAYGHMGREDLGVAWEKTDRTEALKKAVQG